MQQRVSSYIHLLQAQPPTITYVSSSLQCMIKLENTTLYLGLWLQSQKTAIIATVIAIPADMSTFLLIPCKFNRCNKASIKSSLAND
jgi:hypothetical protein